MTKGHGSPSNPSDARPSGSPDDPLADWAHAPPTACAAGTLPHGLDDHLRAVGALAASHASPNAATAARLAGLWHDMGKRRPGFQHYIRQASGSQAHIEGRVADRDKTHSAAGALWAERFWDFFQSARAGAATDR